MESNPLCYGGSLMSMISRWSSAVSVLILIMLTAVGEGTSPKEYTMPGETCSYIVDNGDQFKVVSQQIEHKDNPDQTSYLPDVSCTIIFRGQPGQRIFLRLSLFEVETSRFCTNDGLYMYDGGREDPDRLLSANKHALCGTTLSLPNYFVSSSHEVTLKFVTNGMNNSYRGFSLLITPFSEGGDCDGFVCLMTKRCITKEASCNNEYQCEDGSDEPPNCHFQNTAPSVAMTPSPTAGSGKHLHQTRGAEDPRSLALSCREVVAQQSHADWKERLHVVKRRDTTDTGQLPDGAGFPLSDGLPPPGEPLPPFSPNEDPVTEAPSVAMTPSPTAGSGSPPFRIFFAHLVLCLVSCIFLQQTL